MFAERIEADYATVVEELERKFSSYLTPLPPDPPLGSPAEAYPYFPYIFNENWPVLGASELPPEPGRPLLNESKSPFRSIRIGVRVYYPSLTREDLGAEFADGREAAKRITRMVFSSWLTHFQDDTDLLIDADGNLAIASIDMGDHDRIGNPLFMPGSAGLSILWVHAVEVLIGI